MPRPRRPFPRPGRELRAKIGTRPLTVVELYGRQIPRYGALIRWREERDGRVQSGLVADVREIGGEAVFFVERM